MDSPPSGCDLRGQLGLDPEPVLAKLESSNDLTSEHLVAGLHVGQTQPGHPIRQPSEGTVCQVVGKQLSGLSAEVGKPGAIDNVGRAFEDRFYQPSVVGWILFKVSILTDD